MTAPINVDPAELEKFSALAHHWWDPESEFKPLHQMNPLRLGWIDQIAGLKDKKIVDIGCGGGILADAMARSGAAEVLGVDLAKKSLQVAQLHALEAGTPHITYREISAEALAASNGHHAHRPNNHSLQRWPSFQPLLPLGCRAHHHLHKCKRQEQLAKCWPPPTMGLGVAC